MDSTRGSIEDRFSKLHPLFPVEARIGIVGAGPSGLSAAYALARLGYRDVTVLEKHHTVAGMCETVNIAGKMYDLGGQVTAANCAPVISHLAKETGAEFEEMDSHKLALIDSVTGKYQDMEVAEDYASMISLTLELQDEAKKSGHIGVRALSELASELAPEFLRLHGLQSMPKSVMYGYTASGYGFVQDMPYAYIQEFTRTSMAGKIRRFKGGYGSMWQKLSNALPFEVLCNTEVQKILRGPAEASMIVKKADGEECIMTFDKIILSGALAFTNGRAYRSSLNVVGLDKDVLELNDLEKDLFSQVETIDYYTTVLKIKGFGHIPKGFYYFREFVEDPSTIGHPVAMQRFFEDTDIFLFWSYGNSGDIGGPSVTKNVIDDVKAMGGVVEEVILQRRFKYFPHVNSESMKSGFYEKLEAELQGHQNTFYVGGLMAFELTERNASYAMAMICNHFAHDNDLPAFPYVKRLLPLETECRPHFIRDVTELPVVEFPNISSLDGYLKFWGAHESSRNKTLYHWINEEGRVVSQRTYYELHSNAFIISYNLKMSIKPILKPGDRVLLVYLPGLEFIDAFFGCLRAKLIPVPVLPPDPLQRGGQALTKIENISIACHAKAILSTSYYHAAVRAGFLKNLMNLTKHKNGSSGRWPDLPWVHTDTWIKSSRNTSSKDPNFESLYISSTISEPSPSDLCFLQFTSGSTGDAKGVMITHGGLMHNVKMMRRRYRSTSKTVLVSWLPQYHDMGLIGGLFTSLVCGGSAVLFSPITFIRNPLLWLETITKYRATHSAGPNFAFELVIRRLELSKDMPFDCDLSSLFFIMIAAEPVRQKTLKRFIEICCPFGLSQEVMAPGYGLAENCVFASCAFGQGKPVIVDWQGRVCCGYVDRNDPDVDIRIVDPETGKEREIQGEEGEIWISSPSAGIGYWGSSELSQKTFFNELDSSPGMIFTRTGDLGRIIDGNLFITGRIKDLIIVSGKNIYSADVEKTVENSSETLRPGCCAVIGVPEETLSSMGILVPETSDQIGLVVIAEVREGKPPGEEVIEQIKTRVSEEHGISVASVKLIKPKTICKTTSGKVKRFECLKQFTEGSLSLATGVNSAKKQLFRSFTSIDMIGRRSKSTSANTCPRSHEVSKSLEEITEFLRGLVSELSGMSVDKISLTENLLSHGIDSIGVVRASQKLTNYLGVPVAAIDIFSSACISDLASFLEHLLLNSQSQPIKASSLSFDRDDGFRHDLERSKYWQVFIALIQLLAITYASSLLIIPASLASSMFYNLVSSLDNAVLPHHYVISLFLAPLAWIYYIFLVSISLSFFGRPFLQPNYALNSEICICSTKFVKWWALNKAQQMAGKVLAVHLRGTIFMNLWFEALGAQIDSSALIDTVDISDPSLVSIGKEAVIAEGALIQGHEVRDGVISFLPVKIGRGAFVGPYAVVHKGSVIRENGKVLPLHKTEGGVNFYKASKASKEETPEETIQRIQNKFLPVYHLMGIYAVGLLSSLAAAISYFIYIYLFEYPPLLRHFAFVCIAGAFHWLPATVAGYFTILSVVPVNPVVFAFFIAGAYISHGLLLCLLTGIANHVLTKKNKGRTSSYLRTWLHHRLSVSCHLRFAKLLSGTEAFCAYLRLLGANIGRHCSIRAINPISDIELVSIGDGVHLGDFSHVVPGFYSSEGYSRGMIHVRKNSVIGSQSLVLAGSVIENDVILGALSVAPVNSVLRNGGIYVGTQNPTMVKNIFHALDERIQEMDPTYKKIVGNLSGKLAITTMKVSSRYFHRIGASGGGVLRMYQDLPGLPNHKIFSAGKHFPVIIRHSNSLSADDDARLDARGAAIRILSSDADGLPLLDLTLKTGKAFYARTIADFMSWLVCGLPAREQQVKRAPHIRDAIWGSLRNTNSYTELHYYSNICRLLRFDDGQGMLVKFKLRPRDPLIGEDSGMVEPKCMLPPQTGAVPREEDDNRPLLFLSNDFRKRVEAPGGVCYVLQLQLRPVPSDEAERELALDCTRPWDETEFPHMDVGDITVDRNLTAEQSEKLEFNPFLRCPEVDVIRATSSSQSASIDHGRSLVYEICQHLRNARPLPATWGAFLEQSDTKVDLSGCPMAAVMAGDKSDIRQKLTLERAWHQTLWAALFQPMVQTFMSYFVLGFVICQPIHLIHTAGAQCGLPWLLAPMWVASGITASMACVLARWVLVRKKKSGDTVPMWGREVFMDTAWQALRTVTGDYFMEMTCGSSLFPLWMRLMGADVSQGAYVDTMAALLNPEMVAIEGASAAVGRDALLFGHIYEGEGGRVKFGSIVVEDGAFVGSRAVLMPGVRVEGGASLGALSLAMKEEVVRTG